MGDLGIGFPGHRAREHRKGRTHAKPPENETIVTTTTIDKRKLKDVWELIWELSEKLGFSSDKQT